MTNLTHLRVERDLSQIELVGLTKLSLGAIQRAEKSYDQMTLGRLKMLAEGLDVTLGELLENDLE